jgi:hypothetical protein
VDPLLNKPTIVDPCFSAGDLSVNSSLNDKTESVRESTVEVSSNGEWFRVPALRVNGTEIIVQGRWLKIASVHDDEWLEGELGDPDACVQGLKEKGKGTLRSDVFTFSQRLPATTPKYSFLLEWDSIAAIPITSFENWWEKLPQTTRKNVRRSQKRGVDVAVRELDDKLIRDIVQLNEDSPVRQGKRFIHYRKTFEQTKKDQSTHLDRSDFVCAYSGNELIGLLKIVYGEKIASILQFLPKLSQQDKRPANALIAKAVQICEEKGISYLVYGMFRYGNKRDSSLVEFKIRNGFEEVLVPRFYIPLTTWGAFCLILKLHRGLMGILPPSLITVAARLRAKWYDLIRFSGRCSSMPEQPNCIRQMERSNPPAGSNES